MYKIRGWIYFGGSQKFIVINWEITIIIRDIIEMICCIDNQCMIQINVLISNEIQEDLNWNDKAQNCRYRVSLPRIKYTHIFIVELVLSPASISRTRVWTSVFQGARTWLVIKRNPELTFISGLTWDEVEVADQFIRAEWWLNRPGWDENLPPGLKLRNTG